MSLFHSESSISLEIEPNYFSNIMEERKDSKLGKSDVMTATLNSINTLIGSGLLVLPYAVYQSGLILGGIIMTLTIVLGLYSTYLLIECKNMTGSDSLSSIGHHIYGRKAIFLSGINLLLCIGMPISYFIIISDAATPLFEAAFEKWEYKENIRTIVILSLASLISIPCLKREMHELKYVSLISTVCAVIFCIELLLFSLSDYQENEKPISEFLYQQDLIKFVKTSPNFLLAYCFQPMFLSVYKSLKSQNDKNAWMMSKCSFFLSTCVYLLVIILSLELYGGSIKSDLLLNITQNPNNRFKYLSSFLFLVIAALHIPVIFFVGKESLLAMYCEARYNTISEDNFLTRDNSEGESYNFAVSTRKNVNISSTLNWKEYYPITGLLFLLVVVMSLYFVDLGTMFSMIGAICATLMGYILPTIFFLKLQDGNAGIPTMVISFCVLIFGVTFLVFGFYANLLL